jgi:hypothetical protein
MRILTPLIALALLAVSAREARAEGAVGGQLEATIDIKVLAYDRSLKQRTGGSLVIGVLYRPGSSDSERVKTDMMAAFQKIAEKANVSGMIPKVVALAYKEPLQKAIEEAGVTVLYVTPGLDDVIPAIVGAAERLKLLTLTNQRAHLEEGLVTAVVAKNNRPAIVVNLKAAKKIGVDFDATLLGLAEVIR